MTEGTHRRERGNHLRLQRCVPVQSQDEHLERLRADVDAVLTLQLSDFADEAWAPLAEALAEYGFGVMRAWIASGQIFRELARGRDFAKASPPLAAWLTKDEAESIAGEVVTLALRAFKDDVLAKGVWDARRGASLSTFFVGQCKLQFPNVYRRWHDGERRARSWRRLDPDGIYLHGQAPTAPGGALREQESASAILEQMQPRTARVMHLKFVEGLSYDEIAAVLDDIKDAKAAENLVSRERKKWQTGTRKRAS